MTLANKDCNCTGSNANTKKICHHRWYGKEQHVSSMDLIDGLYQIFVRKSKIPYTGVRTPSDMLWGYLVIPQGLFNASTTCNRCMTYLLRSVQKFVPSYFNGLFVHTRDTDAQADVKVHQIHVRKVLKLMR